MNKWDVVNREEFAQIIDFYQKNPRPKDTRQEVLEEIKTVFRNSGCKYLSAEYLKSKIPNRHELLIKDVLESNNFFKTSFLKNGNYTYGLNDGFYSKLSYAWDWFKNKIKRGNL